MRIDELLMGAVRHVCELVMDHYEDASKSTRHSRKPSVRQKINPAQIIWLTRLQCVLLCGGFGGNGHLQDTLRKMVPELTKVEWYDDVDRG